MRDSAAQIIAALQSTGGLDVEPIAEETLARAGCEPGDDASALVVGLNYDFLILPVASLRGSVEGRTITALHHKDAREFTLNVLIGVARAVYGERGIRSSAADVYRLAGHLAAPGIDRCDITPAFVPRWFAQALRRRVTGTIGSGVWHAIGTSATAR